MAAARGAALPPLKAMAFPCATEISHHSDPTSCWLPFGKITGAPYPKGREGVKKNRLGVQRELWQGRLVTYRLLRRPEMEKPQSCLCKTRGSPPGSPKRGKMVAQAPAEASIPLQAQHRRPRAGSPPPSPQRAWPRGSSAPS